MPARAALFHNFPRKISSLTTNTSSKKTGEFAVMQIYLKQIREQKELSIRALGEKSGVSKSNISQIEAGTLNPTIKAMCKLAKALDVPVGELFSCD